MTPETWSAVAVGVAIAGLFIRVDTRIARLDDHVRGQGERLARLEGRVDTLEGKVDTPEGKVDTLIAAFVKPRDA